MTIDTTFNLDKIAEESLWMAVAICAVTVSMFLDLIVGVHKAKLRGEATTSKGLKRTAQKAERYYVPLLCACCFDFMFSPIYSYPFVTCALGGFLVICEIKSIMENSYTKKQLRDAENTLNVVLKNKDDLAKMIMEAVKQIKPKDDEDAE